MFSPADWSNLMYTAPHAHGVRTFFNTDFPRPKILQIHNLSALNRRQLKLRIESLRQSTTENQLLAASCCQMSAVVSDSMHSESLVLHYS